MKKHLTALSVERIKPPKHGVLEVFDLGYPGLAVRVGHGGAKSFTLFYRHQGKLTRKSLGRWPETNLAKARDEWRRTRESITNGTPLITTKESKELLFESVVEDWLKRDQSRNKPSSLYQVTRSLEADLLPAWRGRRVDAITKADVHALLDSIADRGAPAMARRVQAYIKRFFAWCYERDILKENPIASMPRVGVNVERDRVLTDSELVKVWAACDSIGMFGHAARLLILTGARREEIAALRWSEIEGDTITLAGSRIKNGEPHTIPLSSAAKKLLASVPCIAGSDYVFTKSGNAPINSWSKPKIKLDEVSGVNDWRIHDLRRTTATGLQKRGIGPQTIEAVLGHVGAKSGIVQVYQRHTFDNEKRAALEAWGEHVSALAQ